MAQPAGPDSTRALAAFLAQNTLLSSAAEDQEFWAKLVETAESQRLQPALEVHLQASPHPVPASLRRELQHSLLAWKVKRQAYEKLLHRMEALATQTGIPLLLLKGPALAERLYSSPETRMFRDLDLMVPAEGFLPLVQRLKREGFVETPSPYQGLSGKAVQNWELPLTFSPAEAPGLHIDLHTNLIHRLEPYWIPAGPVWERAVAWRGGLLTLGHEDFLLFLMTHALKHGYFGLQGFLDLHRASRDPHLPRSFPSVLKRAQEHGFGTLVRVAADLGQRLCGPRWPSVPLPRRRAGWAADLLEARLCSRQPFLSERFQLLLTASLLVDSIPRLLRYWRLSLFRPLETIPP